MRAGAKGKNISEIGVLKDCAEKAGWSGEAVEVAQTALSVGKALKKQRALIEEDGGVRRALRRYERR